MLRYVKEEIDDYIDLLYSYLPKMGVDQDKYSEIEKNMYQSLQKQRFDKKIKKVLAYGNKVYHIAYVLERKRGNPKRRITVVGKQILYK